jgi:hypothetical protein
VRSIVGLGSSLGLRIVAKGVETAALLNQLRALGCDIVQGHHIGRPAPADELAASLRRAGHRLTVASPRQPPHTVRSPVDAREGPIRLTRRTTSQASPRDARSRRAFRDAEGWPSNRGGGIGRIALIGMPGCGRGRGRSCRQWTGSALRSLREKRGALVWVPRREAAPSPASGTLLAAGAVPRPTVMKPAASRRFSRPRPTGNLN